MAETSGESGGAERFGVTIIKDVCFGTGGIGFNAASGTGETRNLLMDVYTPAEARVGEKRPVFVLVFGGAFHRGSKEDDTVEDNGRCNTAIAEYCRIFAARGFVCFSVGYRLTGELPDPGHQRWFTDPEAISRSRMDHVRGILGLPPATSRMLADGMEAAFNDVSAAFQYVVANAAEYNVDVSQMAIGGFSAGGTSALYSTFACGVPAAAVVALSGRMEAADIEHYVDGSNSTPILQIVGENDLEYVRELSGVQADRCAKVGVPHTLWKVPGAGHFYPRQSEVTGPGGRASTVEEVIAAFLERALQRVAI